MFITQNQIIFKKWLNVNNIKYFDYNNYISIEVNGIIYNYPKPTIDNDLKRVITNIERKKKRGKNNE